MQNNGNRIRIAMLASGTGTNVENFIRYFARHAQIDISLVVSNKADALVLSRAVNAGIPHLVIRNDQWNDPDLVLGIFTESRIDFIVLAGFLILVPAFLIRQYPDKIINIHPALLPQFGGKGMYGRHVHKAVLESGNPLSGISIHLVNERYDEGRLLFQTTLAVDPADTPESLATKIHKLEYEHFPRVVEAYILTGTC